VQLLVRIEQGFEDPERLRVRWGPRRDDWPGGDGARFVGNQPSIGAEWDVGRHTALSASYAHFFAGDFIKQSGPGKDVDFVAVWLTYKF
jgi:hypothetical protein